MSDRWTKVLCGGCGYQLGVHGDAGEGPCPECGLDRALSSPELRTGSPWQVAAGPAAALRTAWWIMRRPRQSFELIRIDVWRSAALVLVFGALGGLLVWLGVAVSKNGGEFRGLMPALGTMFAGVGVFGALSAVEYGGLRFIGNRHGWRIGHRVSATVVGHASSAWLVSGVMAGVAWNIGVLLPYESRAWVSNSPVWDAWVLSGVHYSLQQPAFVFAFFGLFAGMLVFEVLAYIGVRRCRWANMSG